MVSTGHTLPRECVVKTGVGEGACGNSFLDSRNSSVRVLLGYRIMGRDRNREGVQWRSSKGESCMEVKMCVIGCG